MADDVVVDTNVWVHSGNPDNEYFEHSLALVKWLSEVPTKICTDPGADIVEAKNRSIIFSEYLKHLRFGSPAFSVIAAKAAADQLKEVDRAVGRAALNKINRIITNRVDRTFLRVAVNSSERALVSHDFTDFDAAKRLTIEREFSVSVLEAEDYLELVA